VEIAEAVDGFTNLFTFLVFMPPLSPEKWFSVDRTNTAGHESAAWKDYRAGTLWPVIRIFMLSWCMSSVVVQTLTDTYHSLISDIGTPGSIDPVNRFQKGSVDMSFVSCPCRWRQGRTHDNEYEEYETKMSRDMIWPALLYNMMLFERCKAEMDIRNRHRCMRKRSGTSSKKCSGQWLSTVRMRRRQGPSSNHMRLPFRPT
jgi:hypothetical protein